LNEDLPPTAFGGRPTAKRKRGARGNTYSPGSTPFFMFFNRPQRESSRIGGATHNDLTVSLAIDSMMNCGAALVLMNVFFSANFAILTVSQAIRLRDASRSSVSEDLQI